MQFLVGEGYEGEAILFQGVTTLKGPPTPEHPAGLAEACVVAQLLPLPLPVPSVPPRC